jgi:IS30 family transposase
MQTGAQPAEPKYRRLSAAERDQIANMKAAGHSNAEISRATGRNDGTITRELQRNSSPNNASAAAGGAVSGGEAALVYYANAAHEQACQRALGHRTRDPLKNEFLRGYVEEKLRLRWTPARIAGGLRHEFGKCYERNLCAQTIYEWIYSDDAPADLRTLLPRNAASAGNPSGAASAPASARSQSAQGSRTAPRPSRTALRRGISRATP